MQEACAEWVAMLYYQTLRDPKLTRLSLQGNTQDFAAGAAGAMPPALISLLAPYVRRTIATNQG